MPSAPVTFEKPPRTDASPLREEVEKRYLAYALSTIVSRALPDVRDGLKPVHRRILFAMHGMHLSDSARMRKSAAVVGETIGKYHPHGDQAAYDALVRMAQDFSLRYPLIEGLGNFGSLDGDSPAAMRYTETRLSAIAGLLLKDIDRGTTFFHPTYDAMGDEPDVLPAAIPNLLINGSSGIAVGMSCSFPPHNMREVLAACRASIQNEGIDTRGLLKHIKGPDFPTGAEILCDSGSLEEIYTAGHGFIKVRGQFEIEKLGRGRTNLIVTSIPYSVNKSRLIERIASLIRDKRLKYVYDVRDESTKDVRIVLELRGGDIKPDSVMAFLYRHTDLQINFPLNFIAITPQGVPDRLPLDRIIRYFLDFRYDKTVLRLQHQLDVLTKRIHLLEGFRIIFRDLDRVLAIIRSARSRAEAEAGLTAEFGLDREQVEAVLETRLYRLVAMEIGKVLDELAAKTREAKGIAEDLASAQRLWKIVDNELAEISKKFGDERRTRIVEETHAPAMAYDPDEFVDHGDVTVILSRQGWIRRIKSEVDVGASLKFREGDGPLGWVRVNTGKTVAMFSNLGKVYVLKALDVPSSSGFGEPLGSMLGLADGEHMVGMAAPDPAIAAPAEERVTEDLGIASDEGDGTDVIQASLFDEPEAEHPRQVDDVSVPAPTRGILVTREGKGFRFDYGILREPTKRAGRRLVNLAGEDTVVAVKPERGTHVAVAVDSGKMLVFPAEQVPVLSGPGQGVRMVGLATGSLVAAFESVNEGEKLRVQPPQGEAERIMEVDDLPAGNRGTRGKVVCPGIVEMESIAVDEGPIS
ncbi:MAG: DNA topoisomerase 4 subunit A [Desulfomonile tiedjei]|nr:DNA topoisomerase 4 subunit A [Desulfomonile tiedjei]